LHITAKLSTMSVPTVTAKRHRRGFNRTWVAQRLRSEELVQGHHDTPCDAERPYGKVFSPDVYVLFLDAGFNSNSLFHAAEEIVSPEYLSYLLCINVHVTAADGSSDFRRYDCADRGLQYGGR
jgi:aminoglycoside N3'-acetyltransferase